MNFNEPEQEQGLIKGLSFSNPSLRQIRQIREIKAVSILGISWELEKIRGFESAKGTIS